MTQKRRRQKARSGRAGRKISRRGLIISLAALALTGLAAGLAAFFLLFADSGPKGPPRAAIVDQLGLNAPNPEFVQQATSLLQQAGYTVDYYPYQQVDVDLYRTLPDHHYKFIVFRVHANRLKAEWHGEEIDDVVLFSSQPYDRERYVDDQAANRLVIARYSKNGEPYFGIAPDFFDKHGDFHGTTVVMMGCEGLLSKHAAQAFIDKGAKTYISWNNTVSATHTDTATERLLALLLVDGKTATQAVDQTMAELGPDPLYDSRLEAYPPGS